MMCGSSTRGVRSRTTGHSGSINRLKKDVYLRSSEFRHEKNGKERAEPRVPADIPD